MTDETSRRDFLKTAAGSLLVVFTQEELAKAAMTQEVNPVSPAVRFGVIGIGHGARKSCRRCRACRRLSGAICDSYEPALKKGQEIAPKATVIADYRSYWSRPMLKRSSSLRHLTNIKK
jgi:hypothetical protein